MHQVAGDANRETIAFIAATLSYGSRKQFMPKIAQLAAYAQGDPYAWVREGAFADNVPDDTGCFYRLYTNHAMRHFLQTLQHLLQQYGTLGKFAVRNAPKGQTVEVLTALNRYFSDAGINGMVPRPVSSLCKRPCMFMRWMVRRHSPVDLGLWADRISPASLYIPVDTHVLQTARRLGLLTLKTASWKTVLALTAMMQTVFPGDPARGDYALYGADVMTNQAEQS